VLHIVEFDAPYPRQGTITRALCLGVLFVNSIFSAGEVLNSASTLSAGKSTPTAAPQVNPPSQRTLTSVCQIEKVTNAEAIRQLPVTLEATVTYSRGYQRLVFLQDRNCSVFVRPPSDQQWQPGDRVQVEGITSPSFRPIVIASVIRLVKHGKLPIPISASFDQLIHGQYDARLVRIRAVVREADLVASSFENKVAPVSTVQLELMADGGRIEAEIDRHAGVSLNGLLDAEIEITATESGRFDDKMEPIGVALYSASFNTVRVIRKPATPPHALPFSAVERIVSAQHLRDSSSRVRVHGTITYYQPGWAVVLQDGLGSVWISTNTRDDLRIGDWANASGFPQVRNHLLELTDGEVEDTGAKHPIPPRLADWHHLALWSVNAPEGFQHTLVSIDGRVEAEVREASQDEYVLSSDDRLFTAILRHPVQGSSLFQMVRIPLGSEVRVTGVCIPSEGSTIDRGEEVPFNVLMRSPADLSVIAGPPWLNVSHLMAIVGVLMAVVILISIRGWLLERRLRHEVNETAARNAAQADLERRRGRILERVNSAAPISEILGEIAELVNSGFESASCWFETTDGVVHGKTTQTTQSVTPFQITDSAGGPLGSLCVDFVGKGDPHSPQLLMTVSTGVRLAALAIESRRMQAGLEYSAQYDGLTDIHNRVSFERSCEKLLCNSPLFKVGIVYIDLDDFKKINDRFGHHIGDLYLQESARRMKQQLRSHDLLARLGGDEFAALTAEIHDRVEVEEIADRLRHSFDAPFQLGVYSLSGSASVGIAIYPDDGRTREDLLRAADCAMYCAKRARTEFCSGRCTVQGQS
jgi:diguanylate cyclase (GGDEF)-like protein